MYGYVNMVAIALLIIEIKNIIANEGLIIFFLRYSQTANYIIGLNTKISE